MKQELVEKLTLRYLSHSFPHVVQYPYGRSHPPDFLVEGRIAVEATYLNTVYFDGAERIDVDAHFPSILQSLQNLIRRITATDRVGSVYVNASFSPKLDVARARPSIQQALSSVKFCSSTSGKKFEINSELTLELMWTPTMHSAPFVLGGITVDSPGGFVIPDIIEGVQRITTEKRIKIEKSGRNFEKNWLSVGSHLTTIIDDQELRLIADAIEGDGFWSKVILLDFQKPEESKALVF